MIVCSCNIITRRDIEAVIEEILVADPYAVLTPNLLYHRLGRRGKCCGCFPHVSQILVEQTIAVRRRLDCGETLDRAEEEKLRYTPAA
jgi:bacterioferritin-associated ferredoxin